MNSNYDLLDKLLDNLQIESLQLGGDLTEVRESLVRDINWYRLFISDVIVKYEMKLKNIDSNAVIKLLDMDLVLFGILCYRVSHSLFCIHGDGLNTLTNLHKLMRLKSGFEIYYSSKIGARLNVQHGFGIVIGPRHVIGDDFIIHQGVTIGQNKLYSPEDSVCIGNSVTLYSNVVIAGNLSIADKVVVGAQSFVNKNIEYSGVYVGAPVRYLRANI